MEKRGRGERGEGVNGIRRDRIGPASVAKLLHYFSESCGDFLGIRSAEFKVEFGPQDRSKPVKYISREKKKNKKRIPKIKERKKEKKREKGEECQLTIHADYSLSQP